MVNFKCIIKYVNFLILIIFCSYGAACAASNMPPVHILMPAYNVDKFIDSAVNSVLLQDYSNIKLLIINDGSTDNTLLNIEKLLQANGKSSHKLQIQSSQNNHGIATTRNKLIAWSKIINPDAYIFWLDADDQYVDRSIVSKVINKMQKTSSDICLMNFAVTYEHEDQKANAVGLLAGKSATEEVINHILSMPNHSINPIELPDLLKVTSLGWVKCYSPKVAMPTPLNLPFEDFVYMAALLSVDKITAIPATEEPIKYLRRANSACGNRKNVHFTNDIPKQLKKFFDTVVEDSGHNQNQIQKIIMAKKFVDIKISEYQNLLQNIIKADSNPEIKSDTLVTYLHEAAQLQKYIHVKLAEVSGRQN